MSSDRSTDDPTPENHGAESVVLCQCLLFYYRSLSPLLQSISTLVDRRKSLGRNDFIQR